MSTLYLIACSKKKTPCAGSAHYVYGASQIFGAAYHYALARKNGGRIAIISAKYGLLDPYDRIEPYDLKLSDLNASELAEWRRNVTPQFSKLAQDSATDRVVILAGKAYVRAIAPCLGTIPVDLPLGGLGIGQRLRFFKKAEENLF